MDVIDSRTLFSYHINHIHQFYSIITLFHCDWHSYALFISHPLFYQFYSIINLFHYDWHSYALYISHPIIYHITSNNLSYSSIPFNNHSISLQLTLIRSIHITSLSLSLSSRSSPSHSSSHTHLYPTISSHSSTQLTLLYNHSPLLH